MPQFEIFTAIANGSRRPLHVGRRYEFLVMATTESEARMWIEKWMGAGGQILWIGTGEPDHASVRYQERDSMWVYDQKKWFQMA